MSRTAQANYKIYAPTGMLKFTQSVRMSDKSTVAGSDDNAGHESHDGTSEVFVPPLGGRDDLQRVRQERGQAVMFRTHGTVKARAEKSSESVVTQPVESSSSSSNTAHLFRGNVHIPTTLKINELERNNRSNLTGTR